MTQKFAGRQHACTYFVMGIDKYANRGLTKHFVYVYRIEWDSLMTNCLTLTTLRLGTKIMCVYIYIYLYIAVLISHALHVI